MNDWKVEGLKELGFTETEYEHLTKKQKAMVDAMLKEFSHT